MFETMARMMWRAPTEASEPPLPLVPVRPRIGLALGGGSARGWAHIGVLRAFAEAGVDVDLVAGTSMGALVGGCWLAGRLDELEAFARSLTRRRMFSLLDFTMAGSGLIGGARLAALLDRHLGEARLDALARPFVAVATEVGTGHEVWLSRGRASTAIRASYALPGIFQPVRVGEHWLFDGALVNPVPVSVCRAAGAQVVIAVNLGTDTMHRSRVVRFDTDPVEPPPLTVEPPSALPRFMRRRIVREAEADLPGIPGVMMDAFNIIQDRITRARLAGDPPDASVTPRLGRIGLFDFHRAAEAIDIGYEAGMRSAAHIAETVAAVG